MTDKLDLSLDDIIKQSKSSKRGRGSGRGVRGRGSGRGGRSRPRSAGGVRGGGVQQRRGRGGRSMPYSRPKQIPDVWEHDLYEGGSVPNRRSSGGGIGGLSRGDGKLLVSNLDFGVNDADINELFVEFGPLRKAAVHYDRSGRSVGTAEVIFERRSDAVRAMKQYNNIPLDGRAMKIQLVGDTAGMSASSRVGSAGSGQSGGGSYGGGRRGSTRGGSVRGGRGGRGGRGRGRGGRAKTAPPTKEDLDAELDKYRDRMDTD